MYVQFAGQVLKQTALTKMKMYIISDFVAPMALFSLGTTNSVITVNY